jgi:hypothetical protein
MDAHVYPPAITTLHPEMLPQRRRFLPENHLPPGYTSDRTHTYPPFYPLSHNFSPKANPESAAAAADSSLFGESFNFERQNPAYRSLLEDLPESSGGLFKKIKG